MPFLCKDVVENIVSYIDSELDRATLGALEGHVQDCPECMEFVKTYQKMLKISGKLKEQTFVTPEIRERLKKLLLSKTDSC